MVGTYHNSHSHSFSKRNLKIKNRKDLDRIVESRRLDRLLRDPNYDGGYGQPDATRIEDIFGAGLGQGYVSSGKKRTKWGDHYKHEPIDHDLESTIDQIRNSTGKYKHTKSKKKRKLDQDYNPKSIKELENSGKLSKGSGLPIGLIMGLVFVGIMLVIALPIFDTITTDMQNQNLNSTSDSIDSNLAGFPSLVQDNLLIFVIIIPIALFVLMMARMF